MEKGRERGIDGAPPPFGKSTLHAPTRKKEEAKEAAEQSPPKEGKKRGKKN